MTVRSTAAPMLAAAVALLLAAAPAAPAAAKRCDEPGATWQRATPAEAGMDAAKLQDAVDFGTANLGFAVRVYRHGCLIAADRLEQANRTSTYESWSMAKSVTALIFGRAMTLGLVSPDDVVGGLAPEADAPHGAITVEDLLTMTSGLRWNGLRDYNIATMPDRIVDALTLQPVHQPGTYYEYAQSPISLLAELIGRSAGEDVQAFAQRELFDPLGIPAGSWRWTRDRAGHVGGFYGVNMRPDDFARLGDLMRRGGVWNGRRLLSDEFVRRAVTPSRTNGCYGWLIWLNAGKPCIGPTVSERPVSASREWPDLPADLYHFSGLFGQLVSVFPTQDVEVVRVGQDPGPVSFAGGAGWEHDLYRKVLDAITDQRVDAAHDGPAAGVSNSGNDYGFQTALREPDQYSKGVAQDPLPAAGPARARASRIEPAVGRIARTGRVTLRIACPPRPAGGACDGTATLEGARAPERYRASAGGSVLVRFALTTARLRRARTVAATTLAATARNADGAGGVVTRASVTLARPLPTKAAHTRRAPRRRGARA